MDRKRGKSVNEKTIHTGRNVRRSGLAAQQHSSTVCASTAGVSGRVTRYFVVWLIFALLYSLLIFKLGEAEAALDRRQMLTLMTEYPEIQAEIISIWEKSVGSQDADQDALREAARLLRDKYGYETDTVLSGKTAWEFWGVGIICGTFLFVLCAAADIWQERRKQARGENILAVYECLERFREGDFSDIPDYNSDSEDWMKLWESIQELGGYFEDLRNALAKEEDNTKSFITDISHQLKTPLASLRMSHELIAGDQLTEEERQEFLLQEEREIDKLESLLKELVDLSRLETRMIQLRPLPASIRQTIMEAVSRIYLKARKKQITIQVEMEEELTFCHDVKWTEEAIANVLDNAVKYSGEQTTVSIRVKSLVQNVLIEIEDEGMGIDPGEISKIYQRFYRGSRAKASVRDGVGVGLYLSRMILERQGGTISAKPKAEKGTVFKITLPDMPA